MPPKKLSSKLQEIREEGKFLFVKEEFIKAADIYAGGLKLLGVLDEYKVNSEKPNIAIFNDMSEEEINSEKETLYNNKAICEYKQKHFENGEADCTQALLLFFN
jgi:hypothetical protein